MDHLLPDMRSCVYVQCNVNLSSAFCQSSLLNAIKCLLYSIKFSEGTSSSFIIQYCAGTHFVFCSHEQTSDDQATDQDFGHC